MKRFSTKLSETVLKLGVLLNEICLFSTYACTQWAQNVSREVLFAEFETIFFSISVQNSTNGDGLDLDKQV